MKLLIITDSYPPFHSGGYELRCKEVIDLLKLRSHEVLIISNRPSVEKSIIPTDEPWIFRALHKRASPSSLAQVINDIRDICFIDRRVKQFRPDVIYMWNLSNLSNAIVPYFADQTIPILYDEGGSGLIHIAKIQKRGIYFYKNEEDPRLKQWLKKAIVQVIHVSSFKMIKTEWSWPKNMHIYFNSEGARRFAQDNGVPVEGSKVIRSGIDSLKFIYHHRIGLGSPLRIITPGRIIQHKGTKDSVILVKKLIEEKIDVKLTIVGEIWSKSYFDGIKQFIATNSLSENVKYLPLISQEELVHLYHCSDICFFPSYQKYGLSRVPLEAMACGCLVITYGNESSIEVVQDQKTGLVASEGDIPKVGELIQDLLLHPDQYRRITQAARKQIEHEHTMEHYIDLIEAYLYECLGKNDHKHINNM